MHGEVNPLIWYERVYGALRLPVWAGMFVVGWGVTLLLFTLSTLASGTSSYSFDSGGLAGMLFLLVSITYIHLAAGYLRSAMLNWSRQTEPLLTEDSGIDLSGLFAARGIVVTFALLTAITQSMYALLILPANLTAYQKLIVTIPYDFWEVYLVTIIWMFTYSMYKIYRVGRRPMKLQSFTQDRTLGLRPFGRASLQLSGVYFSIIALALVITVANGTYGIPLMIFAGSLTVFGIGLFLIPLVSLHAKMTRAKQEAHAWISPQYTKLMEIVRDKGVIATDDAVLHRLEGVENINRAIGQIYGWPFDIGIIVRLSAIVLSVTAILLSAVLRSILGF